MFIRFVAWFCCWSWHAFLKVADLINLLRRFLVHWVVCLGSDLFVQAQIAFEKCLNFWVFSVCSSFARHLRRHFGWAVRNFKCKRFLPNHLVSLLMNFRKKCCFTSLIRQFLNNSASFDSKRTQGSTFPAEKTVTISQSYQIFDCKIVVLFITTEVVRETKKNFKR